MQLTSALRHIKHILKTAVFDRLPPDTVVPMFGANRGHRWIIGSGNHNYWLGRDEKQVQRAFQKHIRPGASVYDIGSHVGFYTLLAAKLAGPQGQVYAFEPLPRNFAYVRRHIDLNGIRNAKVYPLALSDRSGEARFAEGENTSSGHVANEGGLKVEVATLDAFIERQGARLPDFVKIDVEGHELAVLRGMEKTLAAKRDITIVLEANADAGEALGFLETQGFAVARIDDSNVVCTR